MAEFKPEQYRVEGETWQRFSENFARALPKILTEADAYLDFYPTSRDTVSQVEFSSSFCNTRIDFYLRGPKLSPSSGKFATAYVEIYEYCYIEVEELEGIDITASNRRFEEFERNSQLAIRNAVNNISETKQVQRVVVNSGWVFTIADGDSRYGGTQFFPIGEVAG